MSIRKKEAHMEKINAANEVQNTENGSIKILMVMAALFWAGAFIAGKLSVEEFPPVSLTFFRFLIASAVIFVILAVKERDISIKKEDLPIFLALGVIGMIGYHILFFMALKYTSPVNAALIGAINPLVTTIFSVIFLKEKIRIVNILAIMVSLSGVVLIVTNGSLDFFADMKFNVGDMLMLVAVVCWAAYAIISKRALARYSPIKVTSYAFLVCTVMLLPFLPLESPMQFLPQTTIGGWTSVVYMAIFASVGGYLIQQMSIKKMGPSKTSLYVNLVPVFSMVLAFFILGEAISAVKVAAASLIIGGVYMNTKFK